MSESWRYVSKESETGEQKKKAEKSKYIGYTKEAFSQCFYSFYSF